MKKFVFVVALSLPAMLGAAVTGEKEGLRLMMEKTIKDYLQKHPEEVREALMVSIHREAAQARAKAQAALKPKLDAKKVELTQTQGAVLLGDEKAAYTGIMFMDPYCGHCETMLQSLEAIVKKNPKVRFLVRVTSMFGRPSALAAQAIFWAQASGKGLDMLRAIKGALKGGGDLTSAMLLKFGKDLGLTGSFENAELKALVQKNDALMKYLGLDGLPMTFLGYEVLEGAVPQKEIEHTLKKLGWAKG